MNPPLHPALAHLFFSEILPKKSIASFLAAQSPEDFPLVLRELVTSINYITLTVILESLSNLQERQQFLDTFIFRYTDVDFFDTFKEQYKEVLPIIAEKIERTLLNIVSDGIES